VLRSSYQPDLPVWPNLGTVELGIVRAEGGLTVRKQIRYVPEDIVLDLSEPDLGHSDGLEILQRHYRQSERPGMGFSKATPAFVCLTHEGGTNPGLYLRKRDGEWWAVHYESGRCASIRLPGPMSDEHKRQTEYWARAAQDAGWRVQLEHALHTGTRPDALIHGPVTTGVEVQRSSMTASRAVIRTQKAATAGVADLWFAGRDGSPPWAWRVPTVLPRELGIDRPLDGDTWTTMPPRRAVTAAGLRVLRAVKCEVGNGSFDRCPYGQRWCGKYHPRPAPWRGVVVDDVAAKFPAGEIVLLRFWGVVVRLGSRRRDAIFLVSPADFRRYEEMTGWSGSVSFKPETEDRPPRTPSGGVECRNEQPSAQPITASIPAQMSRREGIWGINPQTSMFCETCGQSHPIVEHRNCRAAEGSGRRISL